MKRIVKEADIRRSEIILTAQNLFEKHGYAKTSVEAIIQEVGIAKGTFYYYFKSKQDVLKALVETIGLQMEEYFNAILREKNVTAITKLERMLTRKKIKKISNVMELIHKPENRELQEKLNIQAVEIIAPLLAKVIDQGYEEGIFIRQVSVESMQILLAGTQFVLDSGLFNWPPKKRKQFLSSIQSLLEDMTGAESGILHFISQN